MTDDDTADQPTDTVAKHRRKKSTGFPVVSLAEASSILKEAGRYGWEHSTTAFATYMGHGSTNSGAFRQRLAAFRDWKLIAGRGDTLALTDVARLIALPTDDATERQALQTAFMNCHVFVKLYEDSAKGQPLDPEGFGTRAVHDVGVAPGSKEKFVQSFVDSAVVAGLAQLDSEGRVTLVQAAANDPGPTDAPAAPLDRSSPLDPDAASSDSRAPVAGSRTPAVNISLPISGGTIEFLIRSELPLPSSAFVTVGHVVASLEELAESLAENPVGAVQAISEDR